MSYQEQALIFPCQGEQLVGIVSLPDPVDPQHMAPHGVGVVVVVGGPQYRVGSHRQFLQLARALASHGYPVLRFDVRGMGDSTGPLHSFEHIAPDIDSAIDALQRSVPWVKKVVLWGLCDGASAALLYCEEREGARVFALGLLNPWVRSPATLARAHVKHYYRDRLQQREFWQKLASGKVAMSAITGLWNNLRMMLSGAERTEPGRSFQHRMAIAWKQFDRRLLLLLSGADYTAKEFVDHASTDGAWQGLLATNRIQRVDLPLADHTCSDSTHQDQLMYETTLWLDELKAS